MFNTESKIYRFIDQRICGPIEIVEGLGRTILGNKMPSWSLDFLIWKIHKEMDYRKKHGG